MPEISEPHASKHYDGKEDPIDASQLDKMLKIVPYNGKIADITHADTDRHTLDLAAALGETRKIVEVKLIAYRVSGVEWFYVYPNEGSEYRQGVNQTYNMDCVIKDGTQRLQYRLGAANDDWDLWCFGYVVEA